MGVFSSSALGVAALQAGPHALEKGSIPRCEGRASPLPCCEDLPEPVAGDFPEKDHLAVQLDDGDHLAVSLGEKGSPAAL